MPIRVRYFQTAPEIVPVVNEEDGWQPPIPQQAAMFVLPFVDEDRQAPTASDETGWMPPVPASVPYFVLSQVGDDDGRGGAGAFEDYWLQLAQTDYGTQTVRAFGEDFAEGNNPPPPGSTGPEIVGVHMCPSAHGSYHLVGVRM